MYRAANRAPTGLRPSTLAITAGRPSAPGAPLNQPPEFASAYAAGDGPGYARRSNATWEALEQALGALEGGQAVAFGSGMAAATATIDLLEPGSRIAVAASAYIEVRWLLAERAQRGMLEVEVVDPLDTEAVIASTASADAVWLDAIANPTLEVPELDRICAAAEAAGTAVIVDATLATPVLLRPLEHGAAIVIHSATKCIGGHSDLVLGAAVARDPRLAERLRDQRTRAGAVPGTMEAWLALRGLRTLPLRVEHAVASAAVLARRLAEYPTIERVRYPGLPSHPSHAVAARLLDGYGTIVSFDLADATAADRVCERLGVITHASSLGGVESLIDRQSRWHCEPGIADGLLRLSVGCEDREDLWRDLESALAT